MPNIKVAYFINTYPKVSHTFIRREIQALERLGFEVVRIALRGWQEPLPDPVDQAERGRTLYVLRGGIFGLLLPVLRCLVRSPRRFFAALPAVRRMTAESSRSLPFHLAYLAEACQLVAWCRSLGITHVHAHFGTNSAEVAMLAWLLGGVPYSFTVHGPDEFLRPMGLSDKVGHAKFVVAISSFTRGQLLMRTHHAHWPKINVVRCGIETAFYAGYTAPVANNRLVCVGRLCREKGQLLLVEAAAALVARGIDIAIVLAGDGPMRADLEKLIAAMRLQGHIRITGWISSEQVREEILQARALVLPSLAEGLPVVLMEAMALHRPVLTTYIAGIPELVEDRVNGWVIPSGCAASLAVALQECLAASSEKLMQMGQIAGERARVKHSIDLEARKLAGLLGMVA